MRKVICPACSVVFDTFEKLPGLLSQVDTCPYCLERVDVFNLITIDSADDMGRPIVKVTIPACEQHQGLYAVDVRLVWACPVCQCARGDIYPVRSYDGSRYIGVNGWKNPCGHVDGYSAVRAEAKSNGLN